MRRMALVGTVLAYLGAPSLGGCQIGGGCTTEGRFGLLISFVNAANHKPLCGVDVTVSDGAFSDHLADTCNIATAGERAGKYTVVASRPNFKRKEVAAVEVHQNGRHVAGTSLVVELEPVSGDGECHAACGTTNCGECPKAAMVDGSGFRVDATEVAVGDYALFLAANPATAEQPAACAGNLDYAPAHRPAPGIKDAANLPVLVDWCDAHRFCTWAGKRLCGRIGGGPSSPAAAARADSDAWFSACSAGGTRAYPYGNAYEEHRCNMPGGPLQAGEDPYEKRFRAVGTSMCEGGLAGLFDMSGNADEWEDACEGEGAIDACLVRGGASWSTREKARCDAVKLEKRWASLSGFRCCSR